MYDLNMKKLLVIIILWLFWPNVIFANDKFLGPRLSFFGEKFVVFDPNTTSRFKNIKNIETPSFIKKKYESKYDLPESSFQINHYNFRNNLNKSDLFNLYNVETIKFLNDDFYKKISNSSENKTDFLFLIVGEGEKLYSTWSKCTVERKGTLVRLKDFYKNKNLDVSYGTKIGSNEELKVPREVLYIKNGLGDNRYEIRMFCASNDGGGLYRQNGKTRTPDPEWQN